MTSFWLKFFNVTLFCSLLSANLQSHTGVSPVKCITGAMGNTVEVLWGFTVLLSKYGLSMILLATNTIYIYLCHYYAIVNVIECHHVVYTCFFYAIAI